MSSPESPRRIPWHASRGVLGEKKQGQGLTKRIPERYLTGAQRMFSLSTGRK